MADLHQTGTFEERSTDYATQPRHHLIPSYQTVNFIPGHSLQDFDEVMDCNMREGKFDWFKNGKLNAAGNTSAVIYSVYF